MFDRRPPSGARPRLTVVDLGEPETDPSLTDPSFTDPSIEEANDLAGRISAGEFDDQLRQLGSAIGRRMYLVSTLEGLDVRRRFVVGDRVAVRTSVRPRYLHGARGTVMFWIGSRVMVRLDQPVGRFLDGLLRCAPDGLEKLDAD